ncbi:GATA transcription factor 5 [Sesamum alatum]|uniref:GATA transcription factor n=1 Tax=Sesamum alatum TaxID=300844 RepID=A0AAE2CQP8_9LAMI|nr:GATA transcription factor 5 [Sesamum alatum]
MECVQAQGAWVTGFGSEKTDDFFGEDLFVDQLLDFSKAEEHTQHEQVEEPEENKKNTCSVSQQEETVPENSAISVKDVFGSLPQTELSVSAEEGLESLEWLSHFVEDSFCDYSLTGKLPPKPAEPESTVQEQPCFTNPIQTKTRTKRARTGVRVWPVLSPSFTEYSSTSSSSSTSSTTSLSIQRQSVVLLDKKHKKKAVDGSGGGQPRRCSHCGVTKTPQWRAGPLGSKTLCNACGVRYKSGRLLPEYRPACSPSFSSELHSNNHRKVLEMRRKKEASPGPEFLKSY